MTLTLDFQGQILKKMYPWSWLTDWHGMKGMWVDRKLNPLCEIDLSRDLDLGFSRSNLRITVSREWEGDWHGMKVMWVVKILNPPLRDLELRSWSWTFKAKLWNIAVSQECEGQLTWNERDVSQQVVGPTKWPWPLTLPHDLGLGFSRLNFQIAISQEWEGQFTSKERNVGLIWCWTPYAPLTCHMDLPVGYSTCQNNTAAKKGVNTKLSQFPTCGTHLNWVVLFHVPNGFAY